MTFEDVDFLKNNSTEESYIFYTDSRNRNKNLYPNPQQYRIDFTSPFQNVFAFDVLDASIPRTQYAVDTHNNTLIVGFTHKQDSEKSVVIEPKDYTFTFLVQALNEAFLSNDLNIRVVSYSEPPELTNRLLFRSTTAFYINLLDSTINEIIGLDQMPLQDSFPEYTVTKDNSTHNIHSILFQAFQSDGIYPSSSIRFDTFEAFSSRLLSVNDSLEFKFTDTIILKQDIYISPENDGVFEYPKSIAIYLAEQPTVNNMNQSPKTSVYLILDNQTAEDRYHSIVFAHNTSIVTDENVKKLDATYDIDKISIDIPDIDSTNRLVPGNYILLLRFQSVDDNKTTIKFNSSPVKGSLFVNTSTSGSATNNIFEELGEDALHAYLTDDYDVQEGMLMVTIEAREHAVHTLIPPGIINLTGDQYCVLRSPEIEQHMHRNKGFETNTMGLAKFKLGNVGFDDTRFDFSSIPSRKFHPIGKLPSITLEFVGPNGNFYNFRGVNHTITFVLRYYIPKVKEFTNYVLNPDYNPDYFQYIQQESSDSDTE